MNRKKKLPGKKGGNQNKQKQRLKNKKEEEQAGKKGDGQENGNIITRKMIIGWNESKEA